MCYLALILTIDDVINFKIYLLSSSKAMGKKGKRRKEIQKSEYLKCGKSFSD